MHPAGYPPVPRVPLPHFHGGPQSQPYAIPSRGAVHGPVGAVPHVPSPGSRGFGAGRGNSGAPPIGNHLPHQQGTQQPIGSTFNFPALENPNSQPSVGGPSSQPGFANNVCTFIVQTSCTLSSCPCHFFSCLGYDYIFPVDNRCMFKGLANHFVINFLCLECPRYLL